MAATVRIPTPLQRFTAGQAEVGIEAATIREMLQQLEEQFPGIQERLCDPAGHVRRFVNIFLNEEDIRYLQGEETAVKDGDAVTIIPAIAGG